MKKNNDYDMADQSREPGMNLTRRRFSGWRQRPDGGAAAGGAVAAFGAGGGH